MDKYDKLNVQKLYNRGKNEIILGTAGRLVKQKNQTYLIDLARRLKDLRVPFKLLIAGAGKLEEKLKRYAIDSGVEKEVLFLGFIQEIKGFMESIDVFLLSSLWEGFGYVLIEAMASKKPVISLNTSNEHEIVEDQMTGFLIEKNKLEDFAQKVMLFADNRELIAEFGERGRKRAKEIFNIQTTLRNIEKII